MNFLKAIQVQMEINYNPLQTFVGPQLIDNAAYILIALGAFIFILSFLGYCGSIKESRVLLTAYGIFIIIIFCMEVGIWINTLILLLSNISFQIAVIVLAYLYKESHVDAATKGFLTNTLTEHYSVGKDKDAVAFSWDHIMGHFECCGVMDHTDFAKAKLFINTSRENQQVILILIHLIYILFNENQFLRMNLLNLMRPSFMRFVPLITKHMLSFSNLSISSFSVYKT